ncbi:uncharacterized protein MCYG_08599 [Microsporum canis CBS 113480]|uniref:Uncharacterized protein n=1 Tax=Arthroderma otae (strain ATCC MYA-4605 / CBS 113480) TaxID=554155 RepID=C5G0X7_ARTOC|nr:uncharacterized protein MCYG_08599 [Microsporum canis CBS 113480]EEQ35780.1 predicted protein [Microsporum canis CBS 113480]
MSLLAVFVYPFSHTRNYRTNRISYQSQVHHYQLLPSTSTANPALPRKAVKMCQRSHVDSNDDQRTSFPITLLGWNWATSATVRTARVAQPSPSTATTIIGWSISESASPRGRAATNCLVLEAESRESPSIGRASRRSLGKCGLTGITMEIMDGDAM